MSGRVIGAFTFAALVVRALREVIAARPDLVDQVRYPELRGKRPLEVQARTIALEYERLRRGDM